MYGGTVIGFDGASSWSYGNDFARNVIIFNVSNSSSSRTDNRKDDFLVLKHLLMILMVVLALQRNGLVLILMKQRQTKFRVSLHFNMIIVKCLLMEKN